MKRLGLLIIGDEILAGHVQDTNTHWLANRLRQMGVKLARVEVCSDDIPDIAASVQRFTNDLDLDYIITSGGLGPTPDDRTMLGIANAIGVQVVLNPAWEQWMRDRVAEGHKRGYFDSPEPNRGLMKMAMLPEGSEAMPNNIGTALGAIVRTPRAGGETSLFTLPGVPKEFERMFDECVAPRLETTKPQHVEEVQLYTEESRFHDLLEKLEKDHPEVGIGSYPHWGSITIRATGPRDEAKSVIDQIIEFGKDYLSPKDRPPRPDVPRPELD